MVQRDIKILSWNVHGLLKKINNGYVRKLDKSCFQELLKNDYSIIGLSETWANDDSIQHCDLIGYDKCFSLRKKSNSKAKRSSGGIIVYINKDIKAGISEQHSSHCDMIWLKLNRQFFNSEQDVYLCFAYLSPGNSMASINNGNLTDFLERDIAKYSKLGKIILAGDLNSRTGAGTGDHIVNDTTDFLNLPSSYSLQNANILPRYSQDTVDNMHGEWLNDTCINNHLCIVNGRVRGDTMGKMTYFGPRGGSVIDYFIVKDKDLKYVNYMKVNEMSELSDHCPITLSFRTNDVASVETACFNENPGIKLNPPMPIYHWNTESKALFQKTLNLNQLKLGGLLENEYSPNRNGIDKSVQDFTLLMTDLARPCISVSKQKTKKKKMSPKKPGFDSDCLSMKNELKYKLSLMTRYPHSRAYREDYYKFRRTYRKLVKKKQYEFKENILKQLENLKDSNPKAYWNLLEKLKQNKSEIKDTDYISPQDWLAYFKNQSFSHGESDKHLSDLLNEKENQNINIDILDYPISSKEIHDTLSKLSNGKSPAEDMILCEMLKYGRHYITPILLNIFNQCLDCHYFPKSWNTGLITPIHKKGSKDDPQNFRKICLTSTLGKVLTSILQKRLISVIKDGTSDKQLKENQAGFIPKYRTADNIFILSQIIDHSKKHKKPLFLAFIDLKMAFDTINHDGLLYKLLDFGIGGNFYRLVKSIYIDNDYRDGIQHQTGELGSCNEDEKYLRLKLKLQSGISDPFPCNIGVKQGDPLSPILFNCYFDGVIEALGQNITHGFEVQNQQINSLLYADDLVIFSFSKKEMQNNLKKLENYCSFWRLTVNIKKSQIVTINEEEDPKLRYKGSILKQVDCYTYLGVTISNKGLLTSAHQLALKAQKAWFALQNIMYSQNTRSAKLILHLFDCCIRPILLYGSEIWASTLSKTNLFNLKIKPEMVHLKCCRYILGVSKTCSSIGILGELGRLPMSYYVHLNAIKYWAHISLLSDSRLVKQVYEKMKESNGKWYNFIKTSLKSIDIDIGNVQLNNILEQRKFIKRVESGLNERFMKQWQTKIKTSSSKKYKPKLRTYNLFKSDFKAEEYIHKENNFENRRQFSKLRLSDHKLEIELGRRKNIPSDQRFCKQCKVKNKIEDEYHFIIDCKKYSNQRKILFDDITKTNQDFCQLDNNSKFTHIMTCASNMTSILLFVKNSLKLRQND